MVFKTKQSCLVQKGQKEQYSGLGDTLAWLKVDRGVFYLVVDSQPAIFYVCGPYTNNVGNKDVLLVACGWRGRACFCTILRVSIFF